VGATPSDSKNGVTVVPGAARLAARRERDPSCSRPPSRRSLACAFQSR
jgi:hypothetical protein